MLPDRSTNVRHAVGTVIAHVLLLFIYDTDCFQMFRLSRGQIFPKEQFSIYSI